MKKKKNFLNNLMINKDYSKQLYFKSKFKTPTNNNNKINGIEFNKKSTETYRTYKNNVKEGRTISQHKSSPFPLDKITLENDESFF